MAFQIVDDVLDVVATDAQLGKPAGHDLVEGVYTLPVIRTLADGDAGSDKLRRVLGGPLGVRRARHRPRHHPVERRRRRGARRPPTTYARAAQEAVQLARARASPWPRWAQRRRSPAPSPWPPSPASTPSPRATPSASYCLVRGITTAGRPSELAAGTLAADRGRGVPLGHVGVDGARRGRRRRQRRLRSPVGRRTARRRWSPRSRCGRASGSGSRQRCC